MKRLLAIWSGSRPCSRCSIGEPIRVTVAHPALFRYGGYGATEQTTIDVCLTCGGVNPVAVETINPRNHEN